MLKFVSEYISLHRSEIKNVEMTSTYMKIFLYLPDSILFSDARSFSAVLSITDWLRISSSEGPLIADPSGK